MKDGVDVVARIDTATLKHTQLENWHIEFGVITMETFLIVACSIIGFITAFFVLLYSMSYGMRKSSAKFLALLKVKDFHSAYKLMDRGIRDTVPEDEFEEFLYRTGVFSIKEVKDSDFSIGPSHGTFKPIIVREDGGCYQLRLILVKENGEWKVCAIDVLLRLLEARENNEEHKMQSKNIDLDDSHKTLH